MKRTAEKNEYGTVDMGQKIDGNCRAFMCFIERGKGKDEIYGFLLRSSWTMRIASFCCTLLVWIFYVVTTINCRRNSFCVHSFKNCFVREHINTLSTSLRKLFEASFVQISDLFVAPRRAQNRKTNSLLLVSLFLFRFLPTRDCFSISRFSLQRYFLAWQSNIEHNRLSNKSYKISWWILNKQARFELPTKYTEIIQ